MALEDILAPVKWMDEQILRQYTKVTKRWEDKGKSRYSLALKCDLAFLIATYLPSPHIETSISLNDPNYVLTTGRFLFALSLDLIAANNIINTFHNLTKKNQSQGTELAVDKYNHITTKINRGVRMLGWMSMAGLCLYEIGSALLGNDPNVSWRDYLLHTEVMVMSLAAASSMYIKDADPKLLEKQPLRKVVFEKIKEGYRQIKEKVGEALPEPGVRVPIPASHYAQYT